MLIESKKKRLLFQLHKDIDRKFDSICHINIQNYSINGVAIYRGKKCFFKILNEDFFIKEINGYFISYKKIPTMEILFAKRLFNSKKFLIAYSFDDNIKDSKGLLNDILVKNDLKKIISKNDINKFNKVLSMYEDIYSSQIKYYSYCPSNIFFIDRINNRLKKWYMNSKKVNNLEIYTLGKKFDSCIILNEVYTYFVNNLYKKRECVLTQGDPNTLNISTKPCFFDLATAGYNPVVSELAITIISTLLYDNYFCPKYHSKSYFLHEKALEQYNYFKPCLNFKKNNNKITIDSNIVTSKVRKKYILDYLDILEKNNIKISKEIKYYIIMRLLCVFNIKKFDDIDYYYSLFLICYFYKKIGNDFYSSIREIINEMECV